MARTKLFAFTRKALAAAGLQPAPRALTRRTLMMSGAAAAGLAACRPTEALKRVAIIGGGVAGLTVAYRLAKAGHAPTLYEASTRLGGRMFTRRNFTAEGQFCELGGELIDSNHDALRALAAELNVGVDRLAPEGTPGETLYRFGGKIYSQSEMMKDGAGAFAAIARKVAQDQAQLLDLEGNWTPAATALDNISLADYLAGFSGQAPPWALQLLDVAYHGEYGLPITQQSALNFIDFVGVDPQRFEMFGESDEAWRLRGGSSALPDALIANLGAHVVCNLNHRLVRIAREGEAFALTFDGPNGAMMGLADTLVLTLPFTMLREIEGLDLLGLSDMQLRAVRDLGYGDNAKIMVGTKSRPWNTQAPSWPAPASGEFFSDRFQLVWDTSRGQPGAGGVLTNFLSGAHDHIAAYDAMRAGLAEFSPAIVESLDENVMASWFWAEHPFTKGSYAGAKVGQYTTMLGIFDAPTADGRVHFAGEHTSADFLGFMNGAVESGERAARAILGR